jgi:hypothetical protein
MVVRLDVNQERKHASHDVCVDLDQRRRPMAIDGVASEGTLRARPD